jgi:hypothetical protein
MTNKPPINYAKVNFALDKTTYALLEALAEELAEGNKSRALRTAIRMAAGVVIPAKRFEQIAKGTTND